jgi:hypothetical protein
LIAAIFEGELLEVLAEYCRQDSLVSREPESWMCLIDDAAATAVGEIEAWTIGKMRARIPLGITGEEKKAERVDCMLNYGADHDIDLVCGSPWSELCRDYYL